ncbi:MAG: methionyl-tRNA formyltransferase [Dactylosporangium sp.]|nr:methionyl-tRNA formyltransferase [Dactylosporangium sp.]
MRIVLASMGVKEFALLHEVCVHAGHLPVGYACSRSIRPRGEVDSQAVGVASGLLGAIPATVDLLLPADADGLGRAMTGYRPDLLIVYGFNWILPESVLAIPRLGALNVHSSLLPRYRGPAPVLWAIRNGDAAVGVTVHRMDAGVDTGPILAQRGDVPLDDDVTPDRLWPRLRPVLAAVLVDALRKVATGTPGDPQGGGDSCPARFLEPEYSRVDWSRSAREIHNQVRVFGFIGSQEAPVALVDGRWLRLIRTSLVPVVGGHQVDCGDGHAIWIVESTPVPPPATTPVAGT